MTMLLEFLKLDSLFCSVQAALTAWLGVVRAASSSTPGFAPRN